MLIAKAAAETFCRNVLCSGLMRALGLASTKLADPAAVLAIFDRVCLRAVEALPMISPNAGLQMVEDLAGYTKSVAELDVEYLFRTRGAESVMSAFAKVLLDDPEQDASKKILGVFEAVVKARSETWKAQLQATKQGVVSSVVQMIPQGQYVIVRIAKLLALALQSDPTAANPAIIAALGTEKFGSVGPETKEIFLAFVNRFRADCGRITAVVRALHNLCNGMGSAEDFGKFKVQMAEETVTIS